MRTELIEYRKTATVKAKIFELGDEDGFIEVPEHYINQTPIPYIQTLENPKHQGWFGKNYICYGIKGEKWLVEKEIFESSYEAIQALSEEKVVSAEEVLSKYNGFRTSLSYEDLAYLKPDVIQAMHDYAQQPSDENYWKQRCLLAEKCLEENPCEPDITKGQIEAHEAYQQFLNREEKSPVNSNHDANASMNCCCLSASFGFLKSLLMLSSYGKSISSPLLL